MTSRHDYPELADPPKPAEVVQTRCPMCHGIGHKTALVTVSGEEQAARCCWCAGTGFYWTELDELRETAEEARRRLTRARHLP